MEKTRIKELYEKYGFLIFRRCCSILHSEDEAQDALHEVFMKLIRKYDTIRDKERVVSWIYSTATHHCFNLLRTEKRFAREVDCDTLRRMEPDNLETLGARQLVNCLMAVHTPGVREAVYYTYVEKLGQKDIHALTGQSPATIRRNLARFKKSLPALKKRLGVV